MTEIEKNYYQERDALRGKVDELKAIIEAQPNKEYKLEGKGVKVNFGLVWIEMCEVTKLVLIGESNIPSVCNDCSHSFYINLCSTKEIEAIYNAVMDDLEEERIIHTIYGDYRILNDGCLLRAVSVGDPSFFFSFGQGTSEEDMIADIERNWEESYEQGDVD